MSLFRSKKSVNSLYLPPSSPLSFQVEALEPRQMLSADISGISLVSDSGVGNDLFTTDSEIIGQIVNANVGDTLTLEVDTDSDQVVDYRKSLGTFDQATGEFYFDTAEFYGTNNYGAKNLSFRIESTDASQNTTFSNWSDFDFHLVDPNRQLTFSSTGTVVLSSLGDGIRVSDDATGIAYLMLTEESAHSRFGTALDASEDFVVVRYDAVHQNWEFNDDAGWVVFEANSSDRIVAELDFDFQLASMIPDIAEPIGGIQMGVIDSDIIVAFDSFGGQTDAGELEITGTNLQISLVSSPSVEVTLIGDLGAGVTVADDAVGLGYLMFSHSDVATRFSVSPPSAGTASNLIVVRYNEESSTWEYNDDTQWVQFENVSSDRLLARIDLDNRVANTMKGENGELFGIRQGFTDSDITITANQLNGSEDEGEYRVSGSYFRLVPIEYDFGQTIDFGKVTTGSPLTRTVTVTNSFDYTVSIENLSLPVGFSADSFASIDLNPGESTTIDITFDGTYPGDASGIIGIETLSNEVESIQSVHVDAFVSAPSIGLEFNGEPIENQLDFGVVVNGETESRELVIRNNGDGLVQISDVIVPDGFELITPLNQTVLNSGESASFTIGFTGQDLSSVAGLTQVLIEGDILPIATLRLYAEVDVPQLSVSVDGSAVNDTGASVYYGTVLAGQSFDRTLVIQNTGVEILSISEIESPEGITLGGFAGPTDLAVGESLTLTLTFAATAGVQINDTIVVHSNDPNDPSFLVGVTATAVAQNTPAFLNDHGPDIGVSNDPRILIELSNEPFAFEEGEVFAHVDIDGDGVADETLAVDSSHFIYDPQLDSDGAFSREIQFEIVDFVSGQSTFTAWQQFTGTKDSSVADLPATITSIALAGDGLVDNQMMSPVIEGVISNDGSFKDVLVQIDHDGDGVIDGVSFVKDDGTFRYEAYGIELGTHDWTVSIQEFPYEGSPIVSEPQVVQFELLPYPAPELTSLALKEDTGSAGDDGITSQPFVVGSIAELDSEGRYRVYWDSTEDGEFLSSVEVANDGTFEIDIASLGVGSHTVFVKTYDFETDALSDATSLVVVLTEREVPEIVSFSLDNGVLVGEVTDDSTLSGQIVSEWGNSEREIQIDLDQDGQVDQIVFTDEFGNFQFTPETIGFGENTIAIRSITFDPLTGADVTSDWVTTDFDYQKTLDIQLVGFGLNEDDGTGTTTNPLMSGTAMTGGIAAGYVEIEFDYDGDGVAEAFTLTDELGQFSHFADVEIGSEVNVRARVRAIDGGNNQYYFGGWSEKTFTRHPGEPRLSTEDINVLFDTSFSSSSGIESAMGVVLDDLRSQFNDFGSGGGSTGGPSGGGSAGLPGGDGSGGGTNTYEFGFDLGGYMLTIGSSNGGFGVTSLTGNSFDQSQSANYVVMGLGTGMSGDRSGTYSFNGPTGVYSTDASMSYSVSTDMFGETTFTYSIATTLTLGNDTYSSDISGTFSIDATGAFSYSETYSLLGGATQNGDQHSTDYSSTLTSTSGQISAGQATYNLTRTEIVDNSVTQTKTDEFGSTNVTMTQFGTFTETISGSNVGNGVGDYSKSTNSSYTTTVESNETSTEIHANDGFSGTKQRTRYDSYTVTRTETASHTRVSDSWVLDGATFHNIWTTDSESTATVNGTYTDPLRRQMILIDGTTQGAETDSGLVVFQVDSYGIREEGVSYDVQGTVSADGSIDATFIWVADSAVTLETDLAANQTKVDGQYTTTTTGNVDYDLATTHYGNTTGSYHQFIDTFDIDTSGDIVDTTDLTIQSGRVISVVSPTSVSNSTVNSTIHSVGTNTQATTYSSLTGDKSGTFTIEQTTDATDSISESVTYTGHQTQSAVQHVNQNVVVNGTASTSLGLTSHSVLLESGSFYTEGLATHTTGNFTHESTESTLSSHLSDLTYVAASGTTEHIESEGNQTSSGHSIGSGTYQSVEHPDPTQATKTTIGEFTNTSNGSGENWLHTTSNFTLDASGFDEIYTRSYSFESDTTTTFSSNSFDHGTYTTTDGNTNLNGDFDDSSTSDSHSTFSTSVSDSRMVKTTFDEVETHNETSSYGTNNETPDSETLNRNYETLTTSTGTHNTTLTVTNSNYGSRVVSNTDFSRSSEDSGIVFGTRPKSGGGLFFEKQGTREDSSDEVNSTDYYDYSNIRYDSGRTVSSENATQVDSIVESSQTIDYVRNSDGSESRTTNFNSDLSSTTESVSIFSTSYSVGNSPNWNPTISPETNRPNWTYSGYYYSDYIVNVSVTNNFSNRTTGGVIESTVPYNGEESFSASGTFNQTLGGTNETTTLSGTAYASPNGYSRIDSYSRSSSGMLQTDSNGSFNADDNGRTEASTRTRDQWSGSYVTSKSKSYTTHDVGWQRHEDSTLITNSSNYHEIGISEESIDDRGNRRNLQSNGTFSSSTNTSVFTTSQYWSYMTRLPENSSVTVDGSSNNSVSRLHRKGVQLSSIGFDISSNIRFSSGMFNNVGDGTHSSGKYLEFSLQNNFDFTTELGLGSTPLLGLIIYDGFSTDSFFQINLKSNGRFVSSSEIGESSDSHQFYSLVVSDFYQFRNGDVSGEVSGFFVSTEGDKSRTTKTGSVTDNSQVYHRTSEIESNGVSTSFWYEQAESPHALHDAVDSLFNAPEALVARTVALLGQTIEVEYFGAPDWVHDLLGKLDFITKVESSLASERSEYEITTSEQIWDQSRLSVLNDASITSDGNNNNFEPHFEITSDVENTITSISKKANGHQIKVPFVSVTSETSPVMTSSSTFSGILYKGSEHNSTFVNTINLSYHAEGLGTALGPGDDQYTDYFDEEGNLQKGYHISIKTNEVTNEKDNLSASVETESLIDGNEGYQCDEGHEDNQCSTLIPEDEATTTKYSFNLSGARRNEYNSIKEADSPAPKDPPEDQEWHGDVFTWDRTESIYISMGHTQLVTHTPTSTNDLIIRSDEWQGNFRVNEDTWTTSSFPNYYGTIGYGYSYFELHADPSKNNSGEQEYDETPVPLAQYQIAAFFWLDDKVSQILDGVQVALDVASVAADLMSFGLLGSVFDAVNAGISYARGNYTDMALNLAGAIPLVGYAATSLKYAGKIGNLVSVGKHIGNVSQLTKIGSGVTSTSKLGSKAIDSVHHVAKRSGDIGDTGGTLLSKADNLSEAGKCTGKNCFVGDTKVLVLQNAPEKTFAGWEEVSIGGTDKTNQQLASLWFTLSATGVVVAAILKDRSNSKSKKRGGKGKSPMNKIELQNSSSNQLDGHISDDLREWAAEQVQNHLSQVYWDGTPVHSSQADNSLEQKRTEAVEEKAVNELEDVFGEVNIQVASLCDLEEDETDQIEVLNRESQSWWETVIRQPMLTRFLWASLLLSGCIWAALTLYQSGDNSTSMNSSLVGTVAHRDTFSSTSISGIDGPSLAIAASTDLPVGSSLMNIADIRVGMRVAARNPEVNEQERLGFHDPDQATWRFLKLRLDRNSKDPEDAVEIEMIRPLQWLEQNQAVVGGKIYLDLEELGAKGDATVLQIGPCPDIANGPGEVVISTFAHQPTHEILDVTFRSDNGESETIGVTANHPFWSVDQQAFVPAGQLIAGSQVQSVNGDSIKVVSLLPRPGPAERVYNLEVNGEHVYYVGQVESLLVHNIYLTDQEALSQAIKVRYADVKPTELRGALPGPTGTAGHAYGKHGMNNEMVADIINNANRKFIGVNKNDRAVSLFVKDGDVVITQGDDVTRVITAYGVSSITKKPGGRVVPGTPIDIDKILAKGNFMEVN